MKNFAAKLKGLNYKQLVIDHGEKGVFGIFALIVLVFLAGTSWSRYEKAPEEFLEKVTKGESAIKASAFTDERKKEFRSSREIMGEVAKLHTPLEASRFEYPTHWFWPMYPQTERAKEPKLLEVVELLGKSGRFIMIEQPAEPPQNLMAAVIDKSDPAEAAKAGNNDDENAPRKGADDNAPRTGVGASAIQGGGAQASSGPNNMAKMMQGNMGTGSGTGAATINARGVRFVAVRGVFPLKDQIEEFVKALHEQPIKAAELVEFLDFELERQVAASDKPDSWPVAWEKVDLQAALDVIDKVDFDTELVDTAFTDAVFTMPLPQRVAGSWRIYASHPKINALSEEMAEAQSRLNQLLVEKMAEQDKQESASKPGGFASKVNNLRGMRTQMNSSSAGGSQAMMSMAKQVNSDLDAGQAKPYSGGSSAGFGSAVMTMGSQMQKTDARLSKFLLFRYFDFTVTPGNSYRYRVRLVLKNPNFKRPVEDLLDESFAVGDRRTTPWSEPTTPALVAEEQKVFLTKIDRGRPEAGVAPTVTLDVFQWFTDAGTRIAVKLDKLQMGQFVGGRQKTEVLRPKQSLKDEEIPVFTGIILADISPTPISELDATEHADLKIDAKRLKQLGTVDKALLVDRFGQLVTLDPKVAGDDLTDQQKAVDAERKPWQDLKGKADGAGSGRPSDLDRLANKGKSSTAMSSSSDMMKMMSDKTGGAPSPQKKTAGGKPGVGGKKQPKSSGSGSSSGSDM